MASPLFDALNVRLSRELNDPVSAATSNGQRWSSARRDAALNAGIRLFLLKAVQKQNWAALTGYLAEEGQALANNVKALSGWTGGVAWILSAYNTTDSLPVKPFRDQTLRFWTNTGGNSYLTASTTNQYWVRDGSNFRLLDGGSTTSDTINLRYVKQHTDLSANGASDIVVPSEYWEEISNLALSVALRQNPDQTNISRSLVLDNAVDTALAERAQAE